MSPLRTDLRNVDKIEQYDMRDRRQERSRQRAFSTCGKMCIESGGRVYGCLSNYSYSFFFMFVIPENTKLEGQKMKDLPGFPFCIQSLSFGED